MCIYLHYYCNVLVDPRPLPPTHCIADVLCCLEMPTHRTHSRNTQQLRYVLP